MAAETKVRGLPACCTTACALVLTPCAHFAYLLPAAFPLHLRAGKYMQRWDVGQARTARDEEPSRFRLGATSRLVAVPLRSSANWRNRLLGLCEITSGQDHCGAFPPGRDDVR